jgi:hypothetical protein
MTTSTERFRHPPATIGALLLLLSCEGGGNATKAPAPSLTEPEVLGLVRSYLAEQSRPTSEEKEVCAQEPHQEKKPCSQIDIDTDPNKGDEFLARCQPVGGSPGAPYGRKSVTVWATICRRKTVQVPAACLAPHQGGEWKATFKPASRQWLVEVVRSSRGGGSWTIDDATRKVVSHQPPC